MSLALLGSLFMGACTALPVPAPAPAPAPAKPNAAGGPQSGGTSVGTSQVVRDVLAPTLSYSGNVQARSSVNIVPKLSARLEVLNADVGDQVQAGQVLAELDHAQTDAQIGQAQAAVNAAQARLDQAQAGAKPEDVNAAQAVVDQARVRLNQARAGGRPEEVAGAQAQAQQAQTRADQVAAGARDEDRTSLQAAIDQAEAQQDQLRAQLTAAQQTLAESRYRFEQARAGNGGPGVRPEDITTAQTQVDTARTRLAQLQNPRSEDIRAAQAAVDRADSDVEAARDNRDNCGNNTTRTTNQSTTQTATGETSSRTTSSSRQNCTSSQRDALDAQVNSARAAREQARANLDRVRNPSQYDVQAAQQAVSQAETNLQKLRTGGTADVATLELRVAQTQAEADRLQGAVDQASAAISSAQSRLQAAENPDPRDVAQAQAAASQAAANAARVANPDPFVVQNAQATLDQAEAQLAGRVRPFTEQDIRVAAAGVDQAIAALQLVQVQAGDAVIRAPFDGVVSQKLLNPGSLASPNTPILGLVSRDVEVVVQVEEARIGQLQSGQPANLSVSAFPGQLFPGVVQAVAPSADPRSRTFAVRVVPQVQDGRLKDGMFAQVSIVGTGQPALLVPNDAIVTRAGRTVVFVVQNDRAQSREIHLGDTDGRRTVVTDGQLQPGDQVITTDPGSLADGQAVFVEQQNLPPGSQPRPGGTGGNGGTGSSGGSGSGNGRPAPANGG